MTKDNYFIANFCNLKTDGDVGYLYCNPDPDFTSLNYLLDPVWDSPNIHFSKLNRDQYLDYSKIKMAFIHDSVSSWKNVVERNANVCFVFVSRAPQEIDRCIMTPNVIYSDIPSSALIFEIVKEMIQVIQKAPNKNVPFEQVRLICKRCFRNFSELSNLLSIIFLNIADETHQYLYNQLGGKFGNSEWKQQLLNEIKECAEITKNQTVKCWLASLRELIRKGAVNWRDIANDKFKDEFKIVVKEFL